MAEFSLRLAARDEGWRLLRERLAQAARDMQLLAISSEAVNGAALLLVAGNLAELAMSIPMCPAQERSGGLVDASTLLAVQVLQRDTPTDAGRSR